MDTRERKTPQYIAAQFDIMVSRLVPSFASGLENNHWLRLEHESQQEQSFWTRVDPSIPGLLNNKFLWHRSHHRHWAQVPGTVQNPTVPVFIVTPLIFLSIVFSFLFITLFLPWMNLYPSLLESHLFKPFPPGKQVHEDGPFFVSMKMLLIPPFLWVDKVYKE